MDRVSKTTPQGKQIIKDIRLSFFYGAKIGILGLNGAGKSTVMRIIAGVDKNYQGDVVFSKEHSVGYLAQEPILDGEKCLIKVNYSTEKRSISVQKLSSERSRSRSSVTP